jgi:hypothetical protein
MMDQKRQPMEVAARIYGFANGIISDLMTRATKDFTESIFKQYHIPAYAGQWFHGLINDDPQAVILGYLNTDGSFNRADTIEYKGGQAVRFMTMAQILFTIHGALDVIPGLVEGVEYPGGMAEVIAKYALSDLLGNGLDPNSNVSVASAMGIIARVAGAGVGEDGTAWMKNNGYSITGKGSGSFITNQESAYLIMALYEIQSGNSVNALRIGNYTTTAAIQGIDDKYLKSVQAAFELEVLSDPGMSPKELVSVMGLLDMISRLNARMGL